MAIQNGSVDASSPKQADGGLDRNIQHATDGSFEFTYPDSSVAVIGVACKFAGADSLEQLWEILETGTSLCRDLPKDRFPDAWFERRSYSRQFRANTMNDVDAFDNKFFKTASREATFMDPQQRISLEVTYQALESAGYFSRDASEREHDIGCYWGLCTNEYAENVACHPPSAFSLTGSIRPFIAGKISHHFGLTGPAIMIDTACAASGTAMHQACRAVASGECGAALVGGANIFVSPDTFQNLAAGHFTSPTGASKTFDAAADGYCRGEGVAVVVLKKLSAALRDGDPIRAVIASTGVNQNENESSITVPHAPSQAKLYRKALKLAGLNAQDISYVEAHGTGTPVGDPVEAESIRHVFANPSRSRKTYMGSIKSNIGHLEATSGLSGLIKVMLMMQKGLIPPQALFNKLNPAIAPLEPDGIEIAKSIVPWKTRYKAACVNNYGASGTNAVMVVMQSPDMGSAPENESTPFSTCPISLSAFSPSSLKKYCSALLSFLDQSNMAKTDLVPSISYHLGLRSNLDLPYTVYATVSSLQDLKDVLITTISGGCAKKEVKRQPIVLFFGGQTGAMASVPRAVYGSAAIFRKHLDDCDAELRTLGAPSIFPAIFEPGPHDDDVVLLHSILFSVQYASAMAWLDCGLKPDRIIGHSFGQLTALCISGVLSLSEALQFITYRARLIRQRWGKDPGSMIAIEAELDKVSELLTRHAQLGIDIACHNGPQSFVLAGSTASVDALENSLISLSEPVRWKRLQVTNAFHSSLAEQLVQPLQEMAKELNFQQPKIPIETCSEESTWQQVTPDLIASHTRMPVYFRHAVDRISKKLGACTWLEVGSQSSLPLLQRCLGGQPSIHRVRSLSMDSHTSLKRLAEYTTDLWKLDIRVHYWHFHPIQRHQYEMMNLPPYQFDKTRYWLEWKELSTSKAGESALAQQSDTQQISILQPVRIIKSEGDFLINTGCKAWETLCSEHRILGLPICPPSSLLNIILDAIHAVQDNQPRELVLYDMENLELRTPISATPDTGLFLRLHKEANMDSWSVLITDDENSSQVYASGTLTAASQGSRRELARFQRILDYTHIKSITSDADADSVRGKAVYKTFDNVFRVPRYKQHIKEVSAKDNEATSYLTSQAISPVEAIDYFLQIPLLCLNCLRDRQDDEIYINTGMGQVVFNGSFANECNKNTSWVVYCRFFESEDSRIACDVFVFDDENQELCVRILDITFRETNTRSLIQALGGAPASPSSISSGFSTFSDGYEIVEHCKSPTRIQPLESNERTTTLSNDLPDITPHLFDVLARIADVDVDALANDTPITDLGIDSLMGMEVIEEINNFFSVIIDAGEFLSVPDVGSLCELVAGKTEKFSYNSKSSLKANLDNPNRSAPEQVALTPAISDVMFSSDNTRESSSYPQSIDETINTARIAFNMIREEFDVFAKETGCDRFFSDVLPLQEKLIIAYITEAFAKLGCDLSSLEEGKPIPKIHYSARNNKLMVQLMRALRDHGLITKVGSGWIRTSKPLSARPTAAERFDQIQTLFPQFSPEHKLLHAVGSKLDECLSDKIKPLTLFFGDAEKRKVTADQYLIAPIQSSASQHLASFIRKYFSSREIRHAARVLEVGGGTCGTTLYAVKAFAQLGIPVEYTFSDVSPSFISAAKTKLKEYKFVDFRTVDVTQDPPSDVVCRYDMIIATNVIHATPDACRSARNVRTMLRPGGILTLVEYTTPGYLLDVVFGQLDGWWLFEDGRDHAIMNVGEWKAVLERAGFGGVDWTGGQSRESQILRIIMAY